MPNADEPYTPTMDEIRNYYAEEAYDEDGCTAFIEERAQQFDRALATFRAEVRAEVAKEIRADQRDGDEFTEYYNMALRNAARIAEETK